MEFNKHFLYLFINLFSEQILSPQNGWWVDIVSFFNPSL
jgi:hypothetical protein